MSGFQQQEGRGVLFPERNRKHDKAPDFKGKIMIDGKEVKLAGWYKRTNEYTLISLAVDNYVAKQKPQVQYPREVKRPDDAGDLPW